MIKLVLTFIFISICINSSRACEIHVPGKFLIINTGGSFRNVIRTESCSPTQETGFMETLKSIEGRVSSIHLEEILKSKGIEVKIIPEHFQIDHLKSIARNSLNFPDGVRLREIEVQNHSSLLVLEDGDHLELTCSQCTFSNNQLLSLNVKKINGLENTYSANAQFISVQKAYRLLASAKAFSEISHSSISEESVETIPQSELFKDINHLHFYKLNKPLRSGEYLKKSDLTGVNLVRAGNRTDVIIENKLVKLQTYGISRSNGLFGDFVEVYHPEKNKKYLGKVIDINKVVVEL